MTEEEARGKENGSTGLFYDKESGKVLQGELIVESHYMGVRKLWVFNKKAKSNENEHLAHWYCFSVKQTRMGPDGQAEPYYAWSEPDISIRRSITNMLNDIVEDLRGS